MIKIKEMIPLKKLFLPMMIFLMMSCLTFAYVDYEQICGDDGICRDTGQTYFNSAVLTPSIIATSDENALMPPLISDVDNDGVKEIILLKNDEVHFYQANFTTLTLNMVAGIVLPNEIETGNAWIQDLNGDNIKEIIIAGGNNINFVNFWTNHSAGAKNISCVDCAQKDLTGGGSASLIGCSAQDRCAILKISDFNDGTHHSRIFGTGFDYTAIGDNRNAQLSIRLDDGDSNMRCNTAVPYMTVKDTLNNGKYQFIASFINGGNSLELNIISASVNSSLFINNTATFADVGDGFTQSTQPTNCNQISQRFSSVLVSNFVNTYTGDEFVVAMNTVANGYKMYMYRGFGGTLMIDDYPELGEALGSRVGNPFRANMFSDNNNDEFCVIGDYTFSGKGYVYMLCGTEGINPDTFIPSESTNYVYEIDPIVNTTSDYRLLSHSIYSVDAAVEFNGQDQILSPFGIFTASMDDFYVNAYIDVYSMDLHYELPYSNSTWIVNDIVQNNSHNELIGYDGLNLFVISDSYVPRGAVITDITTNPCFKTGPILLNQSVSVFITVENAEGTNVQANASAYYGHPSLNSQTFKGNFLTSGTIFQQIFKANVTGTNIEYLSQAIDDQVNTTVYSVTSLFSVDDEIGQLYGDSSCSLWSATPSPILGSTTTTTLVPQPVQDSFDNLADITGMAAWLWWIILMIILNVAIVLYIRVAPNILFILMGIFNTLMLILGAFFGYISTTVIVIMAVVGAFMIGLPIVLWVLAHGKGNG